MSDNDLVQSKSESESVQKQNKKQKTNNIHNIFSKKVGNLQTDKLEDPRASVQRIVRFSLSYDNIWNRVLERVELEYGARATKIKGDWFEALCILYLELECGYDKVWLWKDVPNDIKKELNLKGRDNGIDLIAYKVMKSENKEEKIAYVAIQCKYRKRSLESHKSILIPDKSSSSFGAKKRIHIATNSLPWKDVSTFYALCSQSGPNSNNNNNTKGGGKSWSRIIVMTNAEKVAQPGGLLDPNHMAITYKHFAKISKSTWEAIAGSSGFSLVYTSSSSTNTTSSLAPNPSFVAHNTNTILSPDDLRKHRANFYDNISKKRKMTISDENDEQ